MRAYIGIIVAFLGIRQLGLAQSQLDSLPVDRLGSVEVITEIYRLPHTRYSLDHFVLVLKTDRFDPVVQYNKGESLSGESRLFLDRARPGDTLILKEVSALNREAPDKGLIKLPERRIVLK